MLIRFVHLQRQAATLRPLFRIFVFHDGFRRSGVITVSPGKLQIWLENVRSQHPAVVAAAAASMCFRRAQKQNGREAIARQKAWLILSPLTWERRRQEQQVKRGYFLLYVGFTDRADAT